MIDFEWFFPVALVLLLWLVERIVKHRGIFFGERERSVLVLHGLSLAIGFVISILMLAFLLIDAGSQRVFSFNQLEMNQYSKYIIGFLLIDLIYYFNHVIHHKFSFLWRLHRLHHSDQSVDALTTWLHHPFELLTSFMFVTAFYFLLDLPLAALVTYTAVMGLHAGFTHSGLFLPDWLDKYLRWVVVTPSAHRVHHSLDMREGNSNFGQVFLLWDWLFGTYVKLDAENLEHLRLGISADQTPRRMNFWGFIKNPFI